MPPFSKLINLVCDYLLISVSLSGSWFVPPSSVLSSGGKTGMFKSEERRCPQNSYLCPDIPIRGHKSPRTELQIQLIPATAKQRQATSRADRVGKGCERHHHHHPPPRLPGCPEMGRRARGGGGLGNPLASFYSTLPTAVPIHSPSSLCTCSSGFNLLPHPIHPRLSSPFKTQFKPYLMWVPFHLAQCLALEMDGWMAGRTGGWDSGWI